MSSASPKSASLNIAVIGPPDSPAVLNAPSSGYNFVFGNSVEDFTTKLDAPIDFDAVVFIPPASPQILIDLWPLIQNSCTWVHSFFAGVDGFKGFFETYLVKDGQVVNKKVAFTNGKGAFSDSLAEYVLAAALHFNKQITRIQANRTSKTWDKFVMPTMKGKTMGFLGFGHIAKQTARAAKAAFGMRVIASRRSPGKGGDGTKALADEVFGQSEMNKVRCSFRLKVAMICCSLIHCR